MKQGDINGTATSLRQSKLSRRKTRASFLDRPKQNRFFLKKLGASSNFSQWNKNRWLNKRNSRYNQSKNKMIEWRRQQRRRLRYIIGRVGWLKRQKRRERRWKYKRPFWRRKSFKRLKLAENAIKGFFLAQKKEHRTFYPFLHKILAKKILWRQYYRRNSLRRYFKNRIALRHYWKYRYGYYTHEKLQNFLQTIKKKARRLLQFFQKYELVLPRYVRWWGLLPSFFDDTLAQVFVSNGYIYVNFKMEINIHYCVKTGDCVFSLWADKVVQKLFFVNDFILFGHCKKLPGRRSFTKKFWLSSAPLDMTSLWKRKKSYPYTFNKRTIPAWLQEKRMKKRRWAIKKRVNSLSYDGLFYLKLIHLLEISSWSPRSLLYYSTLVETSRKIKVIVPIIAYDWFLIAFASTQAWLETNPIVVNKFVSFSYY